ncbi:hypothetical protein T4A_8256 [Trichinella pseudospiralis]|uniref:Uncharacterized protein n=1 Tax=Trichinella pseudospiralis TaxID=6337 RepID=A0A0V1E787_TRIPS|nr:hypothetical protein T4A_8256 [Trichinella pseudospiralis]
MADIPELRLINNRCGRMSLVYEGKTYKLRYTSEQRKYWDIAKYNLGYGWYIKVVSQWDKLVPADEDIGTNKFIVQVLLNKVAFWRSTLIHK